MIKFKTPLIFASTLIVVTLLLSWTFLDHYDATSNSSSSSLWHKDLLSDAAMYGFLTDGNFPSETDLPDAAEDVLVQRMWRDNDHLLMMAYYSQENCPPPYFTIENGYTITFRDDGRWYDKVAGDGLYTARISANVQEFRKQLKNMLKQMKSKRGYKCIRYHNRQRIIDPDAAYSFDLQKFDARRPVSIAGMTLGLADFKPDGNYKDDKDDRDDRDLNSATTGSDDASVLQTAQAAAAATAPTTLDSVKK